MGQRDFIPRLEALRGTAAVLVGVYHAGCAFLPFPDAGVYRPFFGLANGMGCVVVFFVISGYVLARSLDATPDPRWWQFLRNRAFRLLPASIVVVALLTFLHERFGFYVGFEPSFSPLNVLANMVLLRSDINNVMWSLTVEAVATPVIFGAVLMYRRLGPAPLWSAIAVLFGLSFVGQYRDAIGADLAPLYAFIVGVLVHFEGPALARRLSAQRATGMALAGIALFLAAGLLKQSAGLMILMDCVAGAMLVLTISRFPRLAIFKPLDWSVARFYGRISYSYYLFHMMSVGPVLTVGAALFRDLSPLGSALALALATTAVTTIPALLCYRFVELPGIAIGRRLAAHAHRLRPSASV